MFYPHQLIDPEAQTARGVQVILLHRVRHGWRARQNPQVVAVRAADQRVLVLIVQLDDVIAAVERAEERNLQRGGGWRAGKVRFAFTRSICSSPGRNPG